MRGSRELLIRGKLDLGQIEFDGEGDPWLARGFDAGPREYVWYYRPKGESGWNEILRQSEDSFETLTVVGKDDTKAGNEAGYAMQDDKDDGALHLVEEGLADRDRLAMYGWSYGGYCEELQEHGKPCQYVGLEGADHFSSTLFF